ncbi:MAG: DUF4760 domain-containing protein [Acidobacteriaceae bacterium]|nr:DUF4760 domain-containing protein [Acidobacteriaceae bacterium]
MISQKLRLPPIPVLWVVFALFVPLEIGLLLAFHFAPKEWKETIVFGASIVAGAFALYGHLKHVEEKRAEYAQVLIARWSTPNPEFEFWKDALRDVYSGRLYPRSVMRTRSPGGQIVLPDDMKTRNRIAGLLGYCEEVALAVRTGHADEELIQRMLEGVLTSCWNRFKPWIEGEREVLGVEGKGLYIELEKLIERWNR